jgi:glycosyltransferase involved in cell wall biosynthesis
VKDERLRILFVTDFFPPETNAAASRVFERARYWVRWGHEVTVLTSAPNFPFGKIYDGYTNRWYQREVMDGIEVIRVKTFLSRNEGRWRRGLDFVSFFCAAFPVGLFLKKSDVIAATSPNFFAGLAGAFIALFRRKPFVLEIGDLWPAFIVSLGAMKRSLLVRMLEQIELFMYRRADSIICVSGGFRTNLASRGVPEEKLKVVFNGAELETFTPGPADPEDQQRFGLKPLVTFGYYGTFGAAHGLAVTIEAAKELPEVQFLFVGDGAGAADLRNRVAELNLSNVIVSPSVERSMMPRLWRLCDVALVQLKDLPLLNTAIPSKIFEAMASARPILLAAPDGDASRIIESEDCGIHVHPGDLPQLIAAMSRLAEDADLRSELGGKAFAAASRYSREHQARLVLDALVEVRQ